MEEKEKIKVGLIMPISEIDGLSKEHWEEVRMLIKGILKESTKYDFDLNMVSFSKEVGLIHGNIVSNLHDLELTICDISCTNSNVMFELGIRLAFDKAVIIIKDEDTRCPFDISPIQYINYSRSFNYTQILDFKKEFLEKVENTILEYKNNPEYSPFLKYFGKFEAKSLEEKNGIIDAMNDNIINILNILNKMSEKNENAKEQNSASKKENNAYLPLTLKTWNDWNIKENEKMVEAIKNSALYLGVLKTAEAMESQKREELNKSTELPKIEEAAKLMKSNYEKLQEDIKKIPVE